MSDLLIHSMSEFSTLILQALQVAGARNIVEIGAEYGGMSVDIAAYVGARDGTLVSIDPAPKPEFRHWAAANPQVRHIADTSLSALPDLAEVDAWLIDGDHNWYTVHAELNAIAAICRRDGRPLLAFLHDVAWPSGRRDMYYAPDTIPAEFRHPYSFEGGALPGHSPLVHGGGFRGMGQFAWATHEGGPRNGVLTAIDDFRARAHADGHGYAFAVVPAVFGLGVLFTADAPWSDALADLLAPYHQNPLLRRLEDNRLANYLKVLEWQDAASPA
ncbi:class I SAM-dependent methyltransferase [Sphingomonas sp. XXL09]|uniref:class I SAM-dependent methyltransferase n=1 Tax=Sphingomonas sp. XXL09 TaxID=3457787 RepID=UPI00406BDBC4